MDVREPSYEATPAEVARHVYSVLGSQSIEVVDAPLLLRALELYDFAKAYLAARGDGTGSPVVSFDRSLDRVETVTRTEP